MKRALGVGMLLLAGVVPAGCAPQQVARGPRLIEPDYAAPLPPGRTALRRVTDPSRWPDLTTAYRARDPLLLEAIDQSLIWLAAPSSRGFFPFEGITHEQTVAGLRAMEDLLLNAPGESAFLGEMTRLFDIYESVGYDGNGTVLFTGYYAPVFRASRVRTERFTHPLYKRPDNLVTAPTTGEPLGRRTPVGRVVPYYTRREIEESGMFAGNELVWLEDALSAYIVHINGSAKLRLTDGSVMFVGYAGKTDRPYHGLGQSLVEEHLLSENQLSLPAIKELFQRDPERVTELIYRNQNYVFFTEYTGDDWPAGSLGVRVTPEATLATDKKIYPRGGLVLVDTQAVTFSAGKRRFLRFMLDQDTGGAIQAPGRADIFMGVGPTAEILAGGQYAEGRLYYFFLKPEYIDRYAPRSDEPAAP